MLARRQVLLDMDQVICDMHAEWLRRYNADYGDDLKVGEIHSWDIAQFVKPECGDRISSYLHCGDLYDRVLPIDGALEGVRELEKLGYEVDFVSSCVSGIMVDAKIRWLRRHGLVPAKGWPTRFFPVSKKDRVRGHVLVDDYHENLVKFQGLRILFDAPWNQASDIGIRAANWAQVVQFIHALMPNEHYVHTAVA